MLTNAHTAFLLCMVDIDKGLLWGGGRCVGGCLGVWGVCISFMTDRLNKVCHGVPDLQISIGELQLQLAMIMMMTIRQW